jgi:hypothetical protein
MDVVVLTPAREAVAPLAPGSSTGTISRPNTVPIYSGFVDVAAWSIMAGLTKF